MKRKSKPDPDKAARSRAMLQWLFDELLSAWKAKLAALEHAVAKAEKSQKEAS